MKIVCLAISFRNGGRCLGGIEVDHSNNPIFENGRPKWIRPVCSTESEEVPNYLVSDVSLLDILEFQEIRNTGHGHQSENILFQGNSIKKCGRFAFAKLDLLKENDKHYSLFGNFGAAVPADKLDNLNYSLKLLSLENFETNERTFEGKLYPQIKLNFKFRDRDFNFPITDPSFLHRYGHDKNILKVKSKIYVTLSLAAPHNNWSSKLVAAIISDDAANVQVGSSAEYDDLPY